MTRISPALLLLGLLLTGCDRSQEPVTAQTADPAPATQTTAAPMRGMEACPMVVEGTTVEVQDTEDGVAMVFTTTGDVADLQQRVERMARMYEQRGAGHGMRWQQTGRRGGGRGMGPGPRAADGDTPMPPVRPRYQRMDRGALMTLTPEDPADVDAVRARARDHQGRMATGECPYWEQRTTPAPTNGT